MKTLTVINGTMGVGKSAVCRKLKKLLPRCVFLDGDWCWDMDPFLVTEETKALVLGNIRHLLKSFLTCPAYENVLFCWVMDGQDILDAVLGGLPLEDVRVFKITLICGEAELRARLKKDVDAGERSWDVLARSLAKLDRFAAMDTVKLDVTARTADEAARDAYAIVRSTAAPASVWPFWWLR